MPPRPRPLPAGLGPAFASAVAIGAGATARRLRAGDLETPFRGARIARGELDDERHDDEDAEPLAIDRAARAEVLLQARALASVMADGVFFAGCTAAVIHGLPVSHDGELEVAVVAPRRAPRRPGVRGMKVAPHLVRVTEWEGLPVASPASAWAMLGTRLAVRELVVVGDAAVRVPRDRRGQPLQSLTTLSQLAAVVEAGRRPGCARLREALPLIRVGSGSPLETDYRLDAEEAGLPEPALDVEIRDARGRLLGISDLVHAEFRVVVEVEGDHHRTSRRQWYRDLQKYSAYAAHDWEVVRLTARDIRGAQPQAVGLVAAALRRHGWTP